MAHKKGQGSSRNGRDSNAKRLGVKVADGQSILSGGIILKQRGTKIHPGNNVKRAGDDSLFATADGIVKFSKYHPGKYLVAWHPKSSEKNERTTVVVENMNFGEVLYRQIAGAVARRIVNYAKVGDDVTQGADAGFIKFGSRVDLFLPLDSKIKVELNQIVKGGLDTIAEK